MARSITEADAERAAPAQTANGAAAPAQPLDPAFAILRQYYKQLTRLLPSHVIPDAWYSSVYAALYRGQKPGDGIDLWKAANRNPESLLFALFEAARLGHEPGTDQYYLTPRPNKNATGGIEVLGMEGYQGVIDRMYRAGALSVRVAEVRERDDYRYDEDIDLMPHHRFKKFARAAERGEIIGAYAYALLPGNAISKVVEITQDDIERAKEASGSARYTDKATFWNHWHDVVAMVRKTAVHQLEKWVPTSSEFRRVTAETSATAQAIGAVAGQRALTASQGANLAEAIAAGGQEDRAALPASPAAGDGEPPDAPINVMQFAQPPAPEDEPADAAPAERREPERTAPAPAGGWRTEFPPVPGTGTDDPATRPQTTAIGSILGKAGISDDRARYAIAARIAGMTRPITSTSKLTKREAGQVISTLTGWQDDGVLGEQVAAVLTAAADAGLMGDTAPVDPKKLPKPGTKAWHDDMHPRVGPDGRIERDELYLTDGECGICQEIAAGR